MNYICDFCGRRCHGPFGLSQHERVCQTVPEEVRKQGPETVLRYIKGLSNKRNKRKAGVRIMTRTDGKWICTLDGCGTECGSGAGLAKHYASCLTRTPNERVEFKSTLLEMQKKGAAYRARRREKNNNWVQQVAHKNGVEHRTAGGALWVDPPKVQKISPTPMFQDATRTELSFSIDTQGLLGIAKKLLPAIGEVLPELVSLIKFEKLERK